MLNYSVRAENFVRWKPYVPDPVEEAPKEPSTRPGVIHIDDVSYEEFTSLLRKVSRYGVLTSIIQSQDMDNFDIPARRAQSRDKGKGKAHAVDPGRHSVSGRPGVIRIHDVNYKEFTSFLRFSLCGTLTS